MLVFNQCCHGRTGRPVPILGVAFDELCETLSVVVETVHEPGGNYFANKFRLDKSLRRDAWGQ
jgi:hypothetical protein